jgi:plastocyanin
MNSKILLSIFAIATSLALPSSKEAGAGAMPTNTTGSRVRGKVSFQGAPPAPKPLNMAADPSCAKLHASPAMAQEVVVDNQGDMQNVIVFVSDGLGNRAFDPPAQPAVIEQKGCLYLPHVLAVRANQVLQLVNDDSTTHNIHPQPSNNREWNKAEPPGSKLEESFAREEIAIPVKCNVHPWMKGYIAVFKHPYFAVTAKDGSFDLSNLPPGTYTLKAWHEKLGTLAQSVTVGANETKEVNFTFK